VVGAHYDSAQGTLGGDDNAFAVSALIEIARLLKAGAWPQPAPSVKCVFFAIEEMPFFGSPHMGSLVYAVEARARGWDVQAMYSLEMIGYYRDAPGSQTYPWPFGLVYPDRGDFLAFVGDLRSRDLVRKSLRAFRSVARFPSEGIAAPRAVPGLAWSDHWAFWEQGWPAIMITDTAFYRNPHYHAAHDTPDTLDYDRLARVVHGLSEMFRHLYLP
jgi:Zn-dependent M28 family amino/carboxypeptidase